MRISDWSSDVCSSDLLRPAAGQLLWDGRPIAEAPDAHAARLHYLGHLDAVKPVLSVAENLRFWAALRGGMDAPERALEAFALTELRSEERRVGQACVVRVDLGGRRIIKKKINNT